MVAVTASAEGIIINHTHVSGAVAIDRWTFMIMMISETCAVKRGGGEAAMDTIIIAVEAVITQWTLMLGEMVGVT